MIPPSLILFWLIIGPVIGFAIGRARGRPEFGVALGLLVGPIGWLLLVLAPDARRKCPMCLGPVPEAARKCRHCGSDLAGPRPTMLAQLAEPHDWPTNRSNQTNNEHTQDQ